MKILTIITHKKNEKVTFNEPLNKKNTQLIQYSENKEEEINTFFKTFKNKENYTHVVFLTPEDVLLHNYFEIIEEYDKNITVTAETKVSYMPIVRWEPENKFKGFLNSTIWKEAYKPVSRGFLDFELAKKQIDSHLAGVCFDINTVKENPFNSEIKFYSYLNFLNKIVKDENNLVVGIPKIIASTSCDFTLSKEDLKVKTENFKLSQELV